MNDGIPRMRMFAGPNGSGKTTVKNGLGKSPEWFGAYINPDELERSIRESGRVLLAALGLTAGQDELRRYFASSGFLRSTGNNIPADAVVCSQDKIEFRIPNFNSYHASVLSDFLRRKALDGRKSFTFETVMSSRDKVDLLRDARGRGYRTYLYFVATEDPAINIQRVRRRVAEGGHDVPEDKIVARHRRSLELMPEAFVHTSRAYFFDTSGPEAMYFAEGTNGADLRLVPGRISPRWFQPILDRFGLDAADPS